MSQKMIYFGSQIPLQTYVNVCYFLGLEPKAGQDLDPEIITIKDFFNLNNEVRAKFISIMEPKGIIEKLNAEKIDEQILDKETKLWSDEFQKELHFKYKDKYELYQIKGTDLKFIKVSDTSTIREYFIPVNGLTWRTRKNDVLETLANTAKIGIAEKDVLELYRHGDLLLAKVNRNAEVLSYDRSLEKKEYLTKMKKEA